MPVKESGTWNFLPPPNVISPKLVLILRREANGALLQLLGGITNEILDYLIEIQEHSSSPIQLECKYLGQWAVRYLGAVRSVAVSHTHALAQTIGSKKGLGPRDVRCILREVGEFFRKHLFVGKFTPFLTLCVSKFTPFQTLLGGDFTPFLTLSGDKFRPFQTLFVGKFTPFLNLTKPLGRAAEIQSAEVADSYFQQILTESAKTRNLMKPVRDELSKAQEIYGRTKKSRVASESVKPTPAEMLKNPDAFPVMTPKQVMQVLQVSRSTVARWAEGGKLVRTGPAPESGRRARLLIMTESVKKLLDENKV